MAKRKGFTLMELLIACAIFMLLISFALPYVIDYIESGKYGRAQVETASMANDIVRYKYSVGTYPEQLSDLSADNGIYKAGGSLPDFDPWNRAYIYSKDAAKGFGIWSAGSDGVNDSGTGYEGGLQGDDVGVVAK
jgi:prepilin-type N-terminal cleavage/methylation domain-containing protein